MSDDRKVWREVLLQNISAERDRQIERYGFNDELYDGTGPETRWLQPFIPLGAGRIEQVLRDDYEGYKLETGAPTWLHLVREEVAEAFQETDPERLATELLQVAALCVSWCEQLCLRGARPVPEDES